MKGELLRLAGIATLAVSLAMPTAESAEWNMPTEQSNTSLTGIADSDFAERVRKKTDGDIDITVHFGGALGYKTKDQYDAVRNGALVLADSYTGPLVGFDSLWQISALPFLTGSIDDARTLYEAAKPYYEESLADDNQVLLYTIPWTPSGIWANKKVTSAEALNGLKIRTYDPLGQLTFEEAGATPITLTFADVVPQLTTGGIDAVLTSAEGGFRNKFAEMLSHFIEINYAAPLSIIHMNKGVWDGLSEAEQSALREAARETEAMIWERAKKRRNENYAEMREAGVTVIENPPESFLKHLQKSADQAIDQWKDKVGERGNEILEEYRTLQSG